MALKMSSCGDNILFEEGASKPTVSVLIPTYNRACFLPECLESVLSQTFPPSQIIVINDGSTDNTRTVIKPYRAQIEYIEKENGGKSSALNLGMSRVTGNYVWIMDDDDVALPDALERHVELLEQRSDLGFTYSSYYNAGTRVEDGRIDPGQEVQLPSVSEEEFFLRLMKGWNFLMHPCIVVRTSCYRKVGPFSTDLIRSQDYEMALRLCRHFRCAKIDGPTFYYRKHDKLRGSQRDLFEPELINRKWKEYDKKLFRRLRVELSLEEYLPKSVNDGRRGLYDKRRAYLERMTIMASKELFDEMIDDLFMALDENEENQPLSESEHSMVCGAILSAISDRMFLQSVAIKRVKSLWHSSVGQGVLLELSRRLYWRGCYFWNKRKYANVFGLAFASMQLLGFKGCMRMTWRKIGAK